MFGVQHQPTYALYKYIKDPFNLVIAYDISKNLTNHSEYHLYSTGIHADPQKREPGRCISQSVNICEDGEYELSVKTIELDDILEGEKVSLGP